MLSVCVCVCVCVQCPAVRGVALATLDDDAGDDGSVGSSGSVTDSGRGASEEGDSATTPSSSSSAPAAVATAMSRPFPQPPRQESLGMVSRCTISVHLSW